MVNKVTIETLRRLPKIELHAHLSASLSRKSFLKMLQLKNLDGDISFFDSESMDDIFKGIFKKVRESMTHKQDHEYVCREVFKGFYEDNVKYLEIRSTPKELEDLDRKGYIDTVIDIIEEFEHLYPIRYILSLNRQDEPSSFDSVLEELRHNQRWQKYVVGLDYCGNPDMRYITQYSDQIRKGREMGLKLAIHTAEILEQIPETQDILSLMPERLGHYVHSTPQEIQWVKDNGSMIEVCPSSNIITNNYSSIHQHPMRDFMAAGADITVSSDDILIFENTLSEEIGLVCDSFDLGYDFVKKMTLDSLQHSFLSEKLVKEQLERDIIEGFYKEISL